jgi:hypothetical protein
MADEGRAYERYDIALYWRKHRIQCIIHMVNFCFAVQCRVVQDVDNGGAAGTGAALGLVTRFGIIFRIVVVVVILF